MRGRGITQAAGGMLAGVEEARDILRMPEISRFFGIVIRMYFFDHDPPHFHAKYGESEAQFRIRPFGVPT